VGNPLVRQLGRYLRWPRADASCRMGKLRELISAGQSRPHGKWRTKSRSKRARYSLAGRISTTLTEVLPWFSSVVR
jgi:hypothetical protein